MMGNAAGLIGKAGFEGREFWCVRRSRALERVLLEDTHVALI